MAQSVLQHQAAQAQCTLQPVQPTLQSVEQCHSVLHQPIRHGMKLHIPQFVNRVLQPELLEPAHQHQAHSICQHVLQANNQPKPFLVSYKALEQVQPGHTEAALAEAALEPTEPALAA